MLQAGPCLFPRGIMEISEDLQWHQCHADVPPVTFLLKEFRLNFASALQPTEGTCCPGEQYFLAWQWLNIDFSNYDPFLPQGSTH